jgi:hypothetical protein
MKILQSGKGQQIRKPTSGTTQENQPEVVDELDQLVAEYRSKYFAPTGTKAKVAGQPSADLKRWFE